jgi:hypothetical protein
MFSQYQQMGSAAAAGDRESTLMRVSKVMAKPVAAGAIAYAISTFMGQNAGDIPFFGMQLSVAQVLGISVAGGNLIANSFSESVIESVNQYRALGDFEKSLANPLITAGGTLALLYIGDGQIFNTSAMINIVGMAAIAEVGADYTYRNWLAGWFMN